VTGFCEHSNESSGSVGNFWNSRRTINYSKWNLLHVVSQSNLIRLYVRYLKNFHLIIYIFSYVMLRVHEYPLLVCVVWVSVLLTRWSAW
jgi:hypothetical protein